MKYIKYIKDTFFVIIMIYLCITVNDNIILIKKLKNQIEQNKQNLYQTHTVIEDMQKRWEKNLFNNIY